MGKHLVVGHRYVCAVRERSQTVVAGGVVGGAAASQQGSSQQPATTPHRIRQTGRILSLLNFIIMCAFRCATQMIHRYDMEKRICERNLDVQ